MDIAALIVGLAVAQIPATWLALPADATMHAILKPWYVAVAWGMGLFLAVNLFSYISYRMEWTQTQGLGNHYIMVYLGVFLAGPGHGSADNWMKYEGLALYNGIGMLAGFCLAVAIVTISNRYFHRRA